MAADKDAQDKKDYQDYLDYQKYVASHSSAPSKLGSFLSAAGKVLSPGLGLMADEATKSDVAGNPEAPTKAMAVGAANGATFGHEPQIEGGLRALLTPQSYVSARDQAVARNKSIAQAAPMGNLVGSGAGALATSKLPIFQAVADLPMLQEANIAKGAAPYLGGAASTFAKYAGPVAQTLAPAALGGALQNPGDTPGAAPSLQLGQRAGGAGKAAALASFLSIPAVMSAAKPAVANAAIPALKTSTNMTEKQLRDYGANPDLAEEMDDLMRHDPQELDRRMKDQVGDALSGPNSIFEKKSQPLMTQLNTKLAGKGVQVRPSQFEGSAAQPIIQDSMNKMPQKPYTMNVPVEEVQNLDPGQKLGYGRHVFDNSENIFGERPDLPQGMESRAIPDPTRTVQQVSVPRPPVDSFNLTPQQALRASRASGDAAYGKLLQSRAGIGQYNPANDVDALAQRNLSQGIKGAGGDEVADLFSQLSDNANMAKEASHRFGTNPSRILTNSENAIGQVPAKALRQNIDEALGTNFEDQANALSAGQAMNNPDKVNGWIDRTFIHPGTKALVKSLFSPTQQGAYTVDPSTVPALLSGLNATQK